MRKQFRPGKKQSWRLQHEYFSFQSLEPKQDLRLITETLHDDWFGTFSLQLLSHVKIVYAMHRPKVKQTYRRKRLKKQNPKQNTYHQEDHAQPLMAHTAASGQRKNR